MCVWFNMAFTAREKAAEKAVRRLTPFLIKNLNPDVRHELYARDMFTWLEQQTIGMLIYLPHWQKERVLVLAMIPMVLLVAIMIASHRKSTPPVRQDEPTEHQTTDSKNLHEPKAILIESLATGEYWSQNRLT